MPEFNISIRPLLDLMSQRDVTQRVIGRLLQAFAVLVAVGCTVIWFAAWELIWPLGPWGAMAFTFSQIALIAAFAKIVHMVYARGLEISRMPEGEMATLATLAPMIRLPGEMAAVFLAVFSLPAMLLTWAGAGSVVSAFGVPVLGIPAISAGLLAFVTCWVMGVSALVASHVLAASIEALRSIACDLRAMRRGEAASAPSHSKSAMQPASQQQVSASPAVAQAA
jgi:hypothetical protein